VSQHARVEVRWHKDGALGLNWETVDLAPQETVESWEFVRPQFLPHVFAADPVKAEIGMTFRLLALADVECLLDSSPCNRHLLPGLELRRAQCYFPLLGTIAVDLELTGIGFIDGRLRLRAKMAAVSRDIRRQLGQFRAFACAEAGDKQPIRRRDTIAQLRRTRLCGPGLRLDPISSSKEYRAVLELRHRAYLAADIVSSGTRSEDMADPMDLHSLILAARVNDVIVGTGRLIFCHESNHQFLFEKDIPFSAIGRLKRSDCVEVSRFAIDPELQDSDVMSAIVRGFARHAILTDKVGICLARTSQRASYAKYGFVLTSHEVPHPRLPGQTLALMMWTAEYFLAAAFARSKFQKQIISDVRQTAVFANLLRECSEQAADESTATRVFFL
jgi:Acetyltransferase (GNAT) domain